MPRRFRLAFFLALAMLDMASIVAHTAQIAMTDFMKRIYGRTSPAVLQAPGRASCLVRKLLAGTAVL